MHAMREKNQAIKSAKENMQNFVNDHLREYQRLMGMGQTDEAYFQLGMALHPVMDSTSPSHDGFQGWDNVLNTTGYELIKHAVQEQFMSPDQLSKTIELIKQVMDL
jgi:hypothetical protein